MLQTIPAFHITTLLIRRLFWFKGRIELWAFQTINFSSIYVPTTDHDHVSHASHFSQTMREVTSKLEVFTQVAIQIAYVISIAYIIIMNLS